MSQPSDALRIVVVGGGAAGFFAAITCAETNPDATITVLEQGAECLNKVRISGGGRCNVTHACDDPRELAGHYPRGGKAMIGPFTRFRPRDTREWFEQRGVPLKTEPDGRMFPTSDRSETIVNTLLETAAAKAVRVLTKRKVEGLDRDPEGTFRLSLGGGEVREADRVLLAAGGCRSANGGTLAESLGHTLEPPVPSLFTFDLRDAWVKELAGVTVDPVEVVVKTASLREQGALLLTHRGLSGPVILRLSAWGARALHACNYRFALEVNWCPQFSQSALREELNRLRSQHGAKCVVNVALNGLPGRLWERLAQLAGVDRDERWSRLSRSGMNTLLHLLAATPIDVAGKSLNKEEFVTCGGVRLSEVNLKTLESRIVPGLFFAGEILDIDGVTGGFNFQAAWTTGWLAGHGMAGLAG